jgi:exopolyphosphatase/pppGpp-phosphohydrolase
MRSLPLGFLRIQTAAEVRDGAAALAETVRALGSSAVVFTGGTARALARLIGTRGLRRYDLHVLLRKLSNLDGAARLAFGVPFPRLDTIDAGGMVLATLMELLGVEYAQVADSGLREGVLTAMLRPCEPLRARADS